MKRIVHSTLAVMFVLTVSAANADILEYNFPIDSMQEVPPNNSPGTGQGQVTFNTDTNELSWNISYENLTGNPTAAHFHGPADFGQNAGVQVNIGQISGLSSPMIGSTVINDTQESQLLAGMWYVNIHTPMFGGGEIRGQVVNVLPKGDMNCDGTFDGADIDPFFLALGDPTTYQQQFPDCDLLQADMNGDDSVDGADIDPFFECLGGGNCP